MSDKEPKQPEPRPQPSTPAQRGVKRIDRRRLDGEKWRQAEIDAGLHDKDEFWGE